MSARQPHAAKDVSACQRHGAIVASRAVQAETPEQARELFAELVERDIRSGDRKGYFAALHLNTVSEILRQVSAGEFEQGQRIADVLLHFTNRYFAQRNAFETGGAVSASWKVAFEATTNPREVLFGHVVLGMNAHINIDLPIATARAKPLRQDFEKINLVLASLLDRVQQVIYETSRPWKLTKWIAPKLADSLINQGMKLARSHAWWVAQGLSALEEPQLTQELEAIDEAVADIAEAYQAPGKQHPWLMALSRWGEPKSVAEGIRRIRDL